MAGEQEHWYVPRLKRELAERRIERREFLRIATLLGVSSTAAYATAGSILGDGPALAQPAKALPTGGLLRIGSRCQDLSSPHTYSWIESANSARAVCDYLTITGPDNVTRPGLAERWVPSPDLKSWTIHLRRDVKWHKGRQFTAEDVVWNLKRVLDPATGSSMLGLMKSFMLKEVETDQVDDKGAKKKTTQLWDANAIEKVDDFTVRLNGFTAQLAIPEQLYHYPMLILDPAENGKFGVGSNGTGAFELVENEVGRRQVFKARKAYWGNGPYVDQLEFIDLGDEPAAWLSAFASRQVDLLYGSDINLLPAFETIPNATLHRVDTSFTAVARMQPVKPFDDKRVRQALRYATDNAAVLKTAHRNLGVAGDHHHVAPSHPEYAKLPGMGPDVAKARALLKEAGYPDGIDVEIACKPYPNWELQAVTVMVEQWKAAGIRCKINLLPGAQYWEVWTKVPFGFTTWAHRPLGVMNLALAYRTGVPWNESKYSNPEFDKLLSEAEGTLDVEKRREIMARIEAVMLDDGPAVIPLWRAMFTFADKKVQGFQMHPSSYIHANEISVA